MRRSPHNPWPILLTVPLGVLAAVATHYAIALPVLYGSLVAHHPVLQPVFVAESIEGSFHFLAMACGLCALIFLTCSFVPLLVKRAWTLSLLRKGYIVAYLLIWLMAQIVLKTTSVVMEKNLVIDGMATTPILVFYWRWHALWPALCVLILVGVLHVMSLRRIVIALYTGVHDDTPASGDRFLENLRSHGANPPFRKSLLSSAVIHVTVIILLPWLLSLRGCVEDYRIQKGSGSAQAAGAPAPVVKIVKAKKVKKKKFMLNPHSAISFHAPDLDESQVSKEVESMTQLTYQADPTRVLGAAGKGGGGKLGAGGGKGGGWPDGMEGGKVRFIRLEYNGSGWDDGMDAVSRADVNFLNEFAKITGLNTAKQAESHSISLLTKYKKGTAPPFVYMTGDGDINVTASEVQVLRDYLLEGGMLFADCGSPRWDASFRAFIKGVFPGEPLRVIADDDPIFLMPYVFPNGAPPLWHHGGSRAMGVKHKGRWVVFYHPGDINDAWKTGHSGMDPKLAQSATEMGINVVYYAFTHYLEMTRKYRK